MYSLAYKFLHLTKHLLTRARIQGIYLIARYPLAVQAYLEEAAQSNTEAALSGMTHHRRREPARPDREARLLLLNLTIHLHTTWMHQMRSQAALGFTILTFGSKGHS